MFCCDGNGSFLRVHTSTAVPVLTRSLQRNACHKPHPFFSLQLFFFRHPWLIHDKFSSPLVSHAKIVAGRTFVVCKVFASTKIYTTWKKRSKLPHHHQVPLLRVKQKIQGFLSSNHHYSHPLLVVLHNDGTHPPTPVPLDMVPSLGAIPHVTAAVLTLHNGP